MAKPRIWMVEMVAGYLTQKATEAGQSPLEVIATLAPLTGCWGETRGERAAGIRCAARRINNGVAPTLWDED